MTTVDRLSPNDRLMLLASDTWPQEIGALAILDGSGLWTDEGTLRMDILRDRIASRLPLVPRFRQVIVRPGRGRGGPYWVDARGFALKNHIRVVAVDAPGGEAQLLEAVERLRRRRLYPSRPGWEFSFLTGLPDGRLGLFVKVHHAMADGMAAMTLIGAFLDGVADPAPGATPTWRPAPKPRPSDLVLDVLRGRLRSLGGALAVLRRPGASLRKLATALPASRELLADDPPPRTSLDGVVGQDRRLAILRCQHRELRSIARANDATLNDVLLAITAGGLRALLIGRGELADDAWAPIYVPITMRRRWRGPVSGNRVAQMAIPLPLATTDPHDRLRLIAEATAIAKTRDRSAVGKLFRSSIATWLLLKAVDRQRVNVCSANIPGPHRPMFLAGARVLEVVPILPLIGRVSLGVGAVSYAGAFTIGVTADRDRFPDLDVVLQGMEDELAALQPSAEPMAAVA